MTTPMSCPSCKADLKGDRIPQEYIDKGYYGEPTTEPKYYSLVLGIYDMDFDRTVAYQCPICHHRWKA